MPKVIFTKLFIFFSFFIFAQENDAEIEKLMVRKYITCEDIYLNMQELLPRYISQRKIDSVKIIFDFWMRKCGDGYFDESNTRMMILLAISEGNLNENMYPPHLIGHLNHYRHNNDIEFQDFNRDIYDYPNTFRDFTYQLAIDLLPITRPHSLENWFCKFYSEQFKDIYQELAHPALKSTKLKMLYDQELNDTKKIFETEFGFFNGAWIPQGFNDILGVQYLFGLKMGAKTNRVLYNFQISGRPTNTTNNYTVVYQDSLYSVNRFSGLYVGGEIGYEFFRSLHHELDALASIGYDQFTPIPPDEENGIEGKHINSYNFGLGIGYRYYFNERGVHLGLKGEYNFMNYRNQGGTNLSGNAITVTLSIGFLGNIFKENKLKILDYERFKNK